MRPQKMSEVWNSSNGCGWRGFPDSEAPGKVLIPHAALIPASPNVGVLDASAKARSALYGAQLHRVANLHVKKRLG